MNKSEYTRTEIVAYNLALARLHNVRGQGWVTTSEIEGAKIGGSQGTRRVRDLRKYGWNVQVFSASEYAKHKRLGVVPDTSQYYYRIADGDEAMELLNIIEVNDRKRRYKLLTKQENLHNLQPGERQMENQATDKEKILNALQELCNVHGRLPFYLEKIADTAGVPVQEVNSFIYTNNGSLLELKHPAGAKAEKMSDMILQLRSWSVEGKQGRKV